MENLRKHRDIKLVTTNKKRNYLVSEPNYLIDKMFFRTFVSNRNEKNKSKNEKSVYLGLSILEVIKTLMCEFWYDYIKAKYQYSAKLCYMDTDSFIIYIKTLMFMKTCLRGHCR